jgi:plastocyanin
MTWLWRICFSAALASPALVMSALAATVSGTVQLADSRDPRVRSKSDYSGVVLWLEPSEGPAPAIKPSTATIVQKQKRFSPHIIAVPAGTTVDFPNNDPIFHNAFSNFAGQPFDTGLYPPGTTHRVRFLRPGVVRVFCNIHPTMSAVIVVAPTPYVAITKKAGEYSIAGVEPGSYRLRIFHERSPEKTLQAIERTIAVDQPNVQLGAIAISESGYIETPHKNKYGKEYPPVIEDRATYSSLKRAP